MHSAACAQETTAHTRDSCPHERYRPTQETAAHKRHLPTQETPSHTKDTAPYNMLQVYSRRMEAQLAASQALQECYTRCQRSQQLCIRSTQADCTFGSAKLHMPISVSVTALSRGLTSCRHPDAGTKLALAVARAPRPSSRPFFQALLGPADCSSSPHQAHHAAGAGGLGVAPAVAACTHVLITSSLARSHCQICSKVTRLTGQTSSVGPTACAGELEG